MSAPDRHGPVVRTALRLLGDVRLFSRLVVRLPLRDYQLAPVNAVLDSVLHGRGREFLLVFPRQSGKNEAVAQLLVYLLNLYRRRGGQVVYGATGDGLGLGIRRLEQRLDNPWNRGHWTRHAVPTSRVLGNAAVRFLSTHPTAASRGQTADLLLVIDEAQDQVGPHLEAVFTPMRAAANATALYLGTVKTTSDFLWQKKLELERETCADGVQRVWLVTPDRVCAENPAYRTFLDTQVGKYGRHHPIVASEYFLEPLDGGGGLFDPRRRALMHGTHPRLQAPRPGQLYVATLDVAGEDEAPTDPVAQLAYPARDYTVCTIFEVHFPPPGTYSPGPAYHAVDVFVDHGSKHFASPTPPGVVAGLPTAPPPAVAGPCPRKAEGPTEPPSPVRAGLPWPVGQDRPTGPVPTEPPAVAGLPWPVGQDRPTEPPELRSSLVHRLLAYLTHWQVAHLVADESGVGLGLVSWLAAALGPARVTGFPFAPTAKAALGSAFVALVETNRFKYWTSDKEQVTRDKDQGTRDKELDTCHLPLETSDLPLATSDLPLSDAWWFWRQVEACAYDLPPDGTFEKHLRWGVPTAHRTPTPLGLQPTHDDRLLSAALVAELDRLLRAGRVGLGLAASAVVPSSDPLGGAVY